MRAPRLVFQLWTFLFIYIVKQKQKKICGFLVFLCGFTKFYVNQFLWRQNLIILIFNKPFLGTLNPIGSAVFKVYWIQTDGQTNRQTCNVYIQKQISFRVANTFLAGLRIIFLQGCEFCSFNPINAQIITEILEKLSGLFTFLVYLNHWFIRCRLLIANKIFWVLEFVNRCFFISWFFRRVSGNTENVKICFKGLNHKYQDGLKWKVLPSMERFRIEH